MERPGLAFAVIILLGISVIFFVGRGRDVEPTMSEREEMKLKAMEAAQNSFIPLQGAARQKAYDDLKAGATLAEMEIENIGKLKIELYPQAAPQTVAHIVELAKKGYYNGILFHRVVNDFVAQAGDPATKKHKKPEFFGMTWEQAAEKYELGNGGSGKPVVREMKLPHLQYTLGLARGASPDSGDSQFFFNLKENTSLDSAYCAFGRVVEGQELLQKIEIGDKIASFRILN
jgi:cyclophilin family peptidyl-prolyl cis-trans isomerase